MKVILSRTPEVHLFESFSYYSDFKFEQMWCIVIN